MEKVFKIGGQFYPAIIGQFYVAIVPDNFYQGSRPILGGHGDQDHPLIGKGQAWRPLGLEDPEKLFFEIIVSARCRNRPALWSRLQASGYYDKNEFKINTNMNLSARKGDDRQRDSPQWASPPIPLLSRHGPLPE